MNDLVKTTDAATADMLDDLPAVFFEYFEVEGK